MFLEILKKVAPYLKYIIFAAVVVILLIGWRSKSNQLSKLEQEMQLYKRQMAGQLTQKEQQLEKANSALGISQSKLVEQQGLVEAFAGEKIKTSADFEKFKKEYKLELESYQRSVTQLQEQLKTKNSTVVVTTPRESTDPTPDHSRLIDPTKDKLAYNWDSGDGRFKLEDPDIFVANSIKTFSQNQNFRVTGEIYREKVGFLKTNRLVIEEVVPDGKNPDGTQKYRIVGEAKIVDSKFNYTEKAPDSLVPRRGVLGLWGVVSTNFALNNGLNPRLLLGTGIEFLNWNGLGLGMQLYLDTSVWQDSGFGINLAYRPTIKDTQLNLAIGIGLATQFRQPFQSYIPMVGIQFYLWN